MPSIGPRAVVTAAPMSAVLIALNVAVFVAVSIEGGLLDVLALPPDWAGLVEQPWTVLTVFFTAEAVAHIAVAILVIGLFGGKFERAAGSGHVLVVYLLAGMAGSLAIVATATATGVGDPSVGASAAFLGLVGALAASPRHAWGAKLAVGKIVIVVLVIQFVAPAVGFGDWVSSAAHLAGLAVGAAYGYLLRTRSSDPRLAGTPIR
jgi:membrane associated rhomboid family serine protease